MAPAGPAGPADPISPIGPRAPFGPRGPAGPCFPTHSHFSCGLWWHGWCVMRWWCSDSKCRRGTNTCGAGTGIPSAFGVNACRTAAWCSAGCTAALSVVRSAARAAGGVENAATLIGVAALSGAVLAAASVRVWWSCAVPCWTPTTVSVAPASTVRPVVTMTHFWSVPTDR